MIALRVAGDCSVGALVCYCDLTSPKQERGIFIIRLISRGETITVFHENSC